VCRVRQRAEQPLTLRVCMEVEMTPLLLTAGAGEGECERSGMRPLLLIDRPDTPAGFHAPPPVGDDDDLDFEDAEGDAMAETGTNKKRIEELDIKMTQVVQLTEGIPALQKKTDECAQGVGQILTILQAQGLATVTPPGGTPGLGAAYLVSMLKQLPPQLVLLIAVWLLASGKISF